MSSMVMLPPLNIPTFEKTSGLASVITRVCIPPIERPAMARFPGSASVRYFESIIGIMSFSKVFIKPSAQPWGGHCAGRSAPSRLRGGLGIAQVPLSITIINGTDLPSAIRLSIIKPA